MKTKVSYRRLARWTKGVCAGLGVSLAAWGAAAPGPSLGVGFKGLEIFPVDPLVSSLRRADLNGDGLNDVVVANNTRTKLVVLYNQTGKTNAPAPVAKRELNELPPDSRFRMETIAAEKRIGDIALADFNGDRQIDIAYFGDPKELVVLYNQGTNGWAPPKRWVIEDGQSTSTCLAAGDLNGDGLADLLVLGETQLHFFAQKSDHSLAEPEKLAFSGAVKAIELLDLDGDGKLDLLLANPDSPTPLRFRLQKGGRLGPEVYFELPSLRDWCLDDLDGDGKAEMATITQNSGRAQVYKFTQKPAEKAGSQCAAGQFQVLPLSKSTKSKRGVTWGDVNNDGRADLVVAEADSGQLLIYLQQEDGSLGAGKVYPTFTGVSDLAVGDWDGDGKAEIFLLSGDERQVGLTRFDAAGKVAFPTSIPLEGKPLAMALGRLAAAGNPALAVILDQEGRRVLVTRTAAGKAVTQKLAESFKANPTSITFHDADQDGLADLVLLVPYEKIKVLRQVAGKDFEELDVAAPGGTAEQPWLARADIDGDGKPELLLAQKNFVRAVVLKAEDTRPDAPKNWGFAVKDQINGASANSRIVGAVALKPAGQASPSLFLLDAERKGLTVSERDAAGVWQVVRNLSLPVTEFTELQPLALGGKEANSIAFLGHAAIGWLPTGGPVWELKELDGYETPVKDGRLGGVFIGNLGPNGGKALVFLETARNYLEVVLCGPGGKLGAANRWPVFEERTFRSRRSEAPEPREAVVADFTGDGKNDLLIIVHDRLLLYPQE